MAECSVRIARCVPRSIAGIGTLRDVAGLCAALKADFGVQVPAEPGFVQAGESILARLGPDRFSVHGRRDAGLPARLARSLAGIAAVTDQSDLWYSVSVSGADAREVLARVVPLDLDPAGFPVGALALTRAGHLDVRLWRIADAGYEIAVARSYADDLDHVLAAASTGPIAEGRARQGADAKG